MRTLTTLTSVGAAPLPYPEEEVGGNMTTLLLISVVRQPGYAARTAFPSAQVSILVRIASIECRETEIRSLTKVTE